MNLKNNSHEMNTVVETFVIEETASLIYDNEQLEKWNEKIAQLGLTGQTQIQTKEKSPVPFLHMKQNLVQTFTTLCPVKVDVKDYSLTPIPLEILDLVALSVNEKYFEKIQIWYDGKSPDPVCVGLKYGNDKDRANGYSWRMEHYLLGKWADVKQTFVELTERAKIRWKAEKENSIKEQIKSYTRQLEDIETDCFNAFGAANGNDGLDLLPF